MNTLPPLPLIGKSLFMDNSGWMEGMNTCSRLLEYKSLHERISKGEKAALNYGSAIHMSHELRYSRYGNKPVDQSYYDDLGVLFTRFFTQHPPPADDWRTLNWAMETARKYNERYSQEEFNLLKYDTPLDCPHCKGVGSEERTQEEAAWGITPCLWCKGSGKRSFLVELPFAFPLYQHLGPNDYYNQKGENIGPNVLVIYTGRIDLPTVWSGELFSMDTKSGASIVDTFWNEQRLSAQHRGYCWALAKVANLPVKGFIVNAVRSKGPPNYVLEGTAFKGKTKKPNEWWQESFQRERIYLQPGELDYFTNNTIELVEEFFWHYNRGYMPMKTKWCSSYGKCQYFDVCKLVPEDRLAFLNSGLFTKNVWSPLQQPTQAMQ